MSSLGSDVWRSVAWSQANIFFFLYDRFLLDCSVTMFDNSVFGGLPKCASKGFIFVVVLGLSLIDSLIFATIVARSDEDHNGSCSITAILRFIVWINISTIPVALWSPAGANISLIFLFLQKISNLRALNAWAWSHLSDRGMPWNWQHSDRLFNVVSVSRSSETCACGKRVSRSTEINI